MKPLAVAFLAAVACLAASKTNIQGNSYGSPNAPVLIEVFSDFQCPGCKALHDTMLPFLMNEYVVPGKVYLVYRYFPLPLNVHKFGRVAAEFACAAAHIDKYEPVADILFAQQAVWGVKGNVEETVDSVLTPTEAKKVKSLLKDPAVQGEIETDLAEGRNVPVPGTPTMWITAHGKSTPLTWPINYSLLKSLLDDSLARR